MTSEPVRDAESVARRTRRMLWRYRWQAWRDGMSVRELMRIAKTYRLMERRWKAEHNDGSPDA